MFVFNIVPEVSEIVLGSFHSFYFSLLFRSYVHHFIFQLTDSFFCFRYSAFDFFWSIFNFSNCVVSVCLFFNSSRSLLIDSCIFSILFSRFLIIFTIIILNSFSGSLPISSSFISNYVFLLCSFICALFLCLFIMCFFFKLIVFEVSFSQASRLNTFFLLVSALPGPVVCVRFLQGEICAEFYLFVHFSSDGQG